MSSKYKFSNPSGVYFVSFATVHWIDIFVREVYCNEIVQSLSYCIAAKGMRLHAWCIMPSHIHLIFGASNNNPEAVIRDFKKFTSKRILELLVTNKQESRKEWILDLMKKAGNTKNNVIHYQFWQHDNHPIELWSDLVLKQKLDYLHNNPVVSGLVCNASDWKYSSAIDYAGGKGFINIQIL